MEDREYDSMSVHKVIHTHMIHSYVTCEHVCHESCHIWMSHVTCEHVTHVHMYVHAYYPMDKSINMYAYMCTWQVMEDREYDGMTIPKGDKVFVSPSLAGRRADVFTNPDEYDPLRCVVNMCLHVFSYIQCNTKRVCICIACRQTCTDVFTNPEAYDPLRCVVNKWVYTSVRTITHNKSLCLLRSGADAQTTHEPRWGRSSPVCNEYVCVCIYIYICIHN